jgi:hypothetical protein
MLRSAGTRGVSQQLVITTGGDVDYAALFEDRGAGSESHRATRMRSQNAGGTLMAAAGRC